MTPEQEGHLTMILGVFQSRCASKYRAGQAEHGGNLWDFGILHLVEMAIDEAIDQVVYLLTLREKLLAEKNKPKTITGSDFTVSW